VAGFFPAIHVLVVRRIKEGVDHWDRPVMTICLFQYCASLSCGTFGRLLRYRPALRNEGRGIAMSDSYIIEVGSQAAGIVVRTPEGYRFFAATQRFNQMEGQLFRNARDAERAAIRLANGDRTLAA
jgi:hypothetical protein